MSYRAIFLLFGGLAAVSHAQTLSRISTDPALTGPQRWQLYVRGNFASPGAATRILFGSIASQIANRPPEWERSASGFGKRVGLAAVTFTSRDAVEHGVSALTGRDPRYQRCGCSGTGRRLGHAFVGLFVSADSSGHRRFDLTHLGAAYASGYAGAALYPDNYSVRVKGLQLGHRQVGQALLNNILAEFRDELRQVFRRRKKN